MRGYAQYCPVAKGTEGLGGRGALLRARERAEVVDRRTGPRGRPLEYRLTPAGRDLQPVVQAIGEWGATWSFTEPRAEELDPDLLIVWMGRHVERRRLPPHPIAVKLDC